MLQALTAHLWQSTFFVLAAGLLTVAFRRNRAQVRYWLWLSASIKFFVPFALLTGLGSTLEPWVPAAHRLAAPAVAYTVEQFSAPVSLPDIAPSARASSGSFDWIPAALFSAWLCGFVAIVTVRFRLWLRIRTVVRGSFAVDIPAAVDVRASPEMLEPGVVGLLRPVLLLPEGIVERLTPSELGTILAHEVCHVRRRDNLFASIHMIVEAVFWFHPLVWWIGARLMEEREGACDEEVLRLGNQPDIYADAILSICKLYVESPLACVSGVSGASIGRRIEAIMTNRKVHGLTRARKFLLATAGIVALAGPVAIGLGNVPAMRAQSPLAQAAQPALPVQIAQAQAAPARSAAPRPAPAPTPKFDAASIKACNPDDGTVGGRGGRGTGGGRYLGPSPGRLSITCMSVADLIDIADVQFGSEPLANDSTGPFDTARLKGGPAWAYSDRYTIEARTDDPVANGSTDGMGSPAFRMLSGPMLHTLLEDRFQLKTHRETEEVAMYALTVARSGLKVKPMVEGDCEPGGPPHWLPGGKPPCGWIGWGVNGPNRTLLGGGVPLSRIASSLGDLILDRHVLDRTGIADRFLIRLEYAPDESTPLKAGPGPGRQPVDLTSDIPVGATIFTALEQQLGLKLEPIKGPHGYIVIDRLERPSEN